LVGYGGRLQVLLKGADAALLPLQLAPHRSVLVAVAVAPQQQRAAAPGEGGLGLLRGGRGAPQRGGAGAAGRCATADGLGLPPPRLVLGPEETLLLRGQHWWSRRDRAAQRRSLGLPYSSYDVLLSQKSWDFGL
jgi:hypothetical protein